MNLRGPFPFSILASWSLQQGVHSFACPGATGSVCLSVRVHTCTRVLLLQTGVLPESLCWDPNPQGEGIWRWALWGCLGQEDGALMNGVSALTKGAPERSLAPSTTWEHSTKSAPRRGPLPEPKYPDPETSSPQELWEIKFYCSYTTQSILL